ncbi:MAG: T9SS C-terminal target domain-containing protein, partial [Bacteroidota bacterium]
MGTAAGAEGPAASNGVVSLGDGGIATLTFDPPITNGDGFDFAVFENTFLDTFLELAFVEVST